MRGGAIQEKSYSLESYCFGVGASQQGLGAYLFVLRGLWILASWSGGGGTLDVVGSARQPQGRGWRFLTPTTPPRSWLDCPTLAGCRPPISVGHQGNRATLGPEPGDAQPRLGLGDGGGSPKGLPTGPRNDCLGPKPPTQAVF